MDIEQTQRAVFKHGRLRLINIVISQGKYVQSPNPKSIYRIFIKFISSDRVDSLVNEGLLFMNNIDYFRKIENEDVALRGDPHEGLSASYDLNEVVLKIGEHEIFGEAGKIDLRYNHEDKTNIFCLTAINDQDLIDADGNFYLSQDFRKFGDKAVIIAGNDITEFRKRVNKALNNDPNIVQHPNQSVMESPIHYVPRDAHHIEMGIFKKFDDFSWQHEWRIAIKQKLTDGAYGKFKIGSIEDICLVLDTDKLVSEPIQMKRR